MKFRTLLFLGYVLVFVLMIVLAVVTFRGINSLTDTAEMVTHTQKVIRMTNLLEKQLIDMETGQRGFLITGKEEFLEPHHRGEEEFTKIILRLKELVSDNPAQDRRLDNIDRLEKEWLAIAVEPEILVRKKTRKSNFSLKAISAMIEKGTGKKMMDELRDKFAEFIQVEKDLLTIREEDAKLTAWMNIFVVIFGTLLAIVFGVIGMFIISHSIFKQVGGEPSQIAEVTDRIAKGELDIELGKEGESTGILAAIKTMLSSLRDNRRMVKDQDWLKTGIAQLNHIVSGEQDVNKLSAKVISEVTSYMDAQVGGLYLLEDTDEKGASLTLHGTYAYKERKNVSTKFKAGEGLVGQAFIEKRQLVVKNIPENHIKVASGLGESAPRILIETPFMFEKKVIGVIEIGTINDMTDLQLLYLKRAMLVVGVSFNTVITRGKLAMALTESQSFSEELQTQSEELQAQQEELKTANEELEEQTVSLKKSEGSLIAQQEELQAANEELEEKTDFLEKQRSEIIEKNSVLAKTGTELKEKAKELEISSRYKSEFLANMSHELRTPLNSILLLSKDLMNNKNKHLSADDIESAEIVYKSGEDLLNLINEILNLSKIEAGKMTLELQDLKCKDITDDIKLNFAHLVKGKGVRMRVELGENLPASIRTDSQKFHQIIKNLISNASKFTNEGSIDISIHRPGKGVNFFEDGLCAEKTIAVSVTDSGIGIHESKQHEIFEAFQQADGSTSRKYGGTGLGLSISRELSRLLGGDIQLESEIGKGSTFTLYLPEDGPKAIPASEAENAISKSLSVKAAEKSKSVEVLRDKPKALDNSKDIKRQDNSILIIEDDPVFARILMEQCRKNGFKCLTAQNGEEGLNIVADTHPKAIILDIHLPEKDGWEVLDELKKNPKTRHIPIHVMSSADNLENAFSKGVVGTLRKPVSKEDLNKALSNIKSFVNGRKKTLLVVEDNELQLRAIKKIVGHKDVEILEAVSGEATVKLLKSTQIDCIVLDLTLPDMSGLELLGKLNGMKDVMIPPVIVYTGKDLSKAELTKLEKYSETVILKGMKSDDRLLDETALFLHQVIEKNPNFEQVRCSESYSIDTIFKGRKILIVDDDMRNVFALSKILKQKDIVVIKAENGKKALKQLEKNDDIDLVLMDIMMPEMNGYEAIKKIRNKKSKVKNHDILILALTAKAMKQDRGKCIEAGADDYLSKPVDIEKLFSMMRVWLS